MDNLDDFLDGEPTDAPIEPVVAEPEGPARDEHGRFAPKEKGVETPQQPEAVAEPVPPTESGLPKEEYGVVRAIRDENKALKSELESLKSQIQSLQQPQQEPAPPPSIWEDEQGAFHHFGGQIVNQASFNARLDTSEMLASQAHEDFEEMRTKFLQMMELNPALQQQVLSARHPWEKAYTIAKNAAKMEAIGAVDVAELEAKLREKITAELAVQQPAPAPNLPTSLADQQSSRVSAAAPAAPLTLEDILG